MYMWIFGREAKMETKANIYQPVGTFFYEI